MLYSEIAPVAVIDVAAPTDEFHSFQHLFARDAELEIVFGRRFFGGISRVVATLAVAGLDPYMESGALAGSSAPLQRRRDSNFNPLEGFIDGSVSAVSKHIHPIMYLYHV